MKPSDNTKNPVKNSLQYGYVKNVRAKITAKEGNFHEKPLRLCRRLWPIFL